MKTRITAIILALMMCISLLPVSASAEEQEAKSALSAMSDITVDYNDSGNLVFTWAAVPGATGYEIYRASSREEAEAGSFTLVASPKRCCFTDTTASVGQYYYYKLIAVDSYGCHESSKPVIGPALTLYPKVSNVTLSLKKGLLGNNKTELKWDKVSGVDGYIILRGTTNDINTMTPLSGTILSTYSESGWYEGYYYCILGIKNMGEGNDPVPTVPAVVYASSCSHSFSTEIIAPTCASGGYTRHTCKICGYSYEDNKTEPTEHNFSLWITERETSCKIEGLLLRCCQSCAASEERPIARLSHAFGEAEIVTPAGCTKDGIASVTCTVCGETEEQPIAATGHNFGDWIITKPAACTEKGLETRSCSRCTITETREIPAVGHSYVKSVKEPTCDEGGYTTYTCACGESFVSENKAPLGHDFSDWNVLSPATCTEDGLKTRSCSRCYKSETQVIPALGHSYVKTLTAPTCTEDGYTTYTCACGATFIADYVDALGHDYGAVSYEWSLDNGRCTAARVCSHDRTHIDTETVTAVSKVVAEPTCTAKGIMTYTASFKGIAFSTQTKTVELETVSHSYAEPVYEWNEDFTQCIGKRYCTNKDCSECFSEKGAVTDSVLKEPMCETAGERYILAVFNCKAFYAQEKLIELPALGHDYQNGVCTRCGKQDADYMTAPSLSITSSSGKPKITWSAVEGAEKYYIYRSTDGKSFSYATSTTKTSYTYSSAKLGTTYYYKIVAVDAFGAKSEYSNTVSKQCVLPAPGVTISRSEGKAKLSWDKVTGADKYYIYRSTDGSKYSYYTSTTKTSCTDTRSASGTKYYYKVKAVAVVNGKTVYSAYSSAKSLVTTLDTPNVSITTSSGKPKISWSKVTGADKYYIYRSTDGNSFSYYTSTTKTSCTNTGAVKNKKYYYKVKAVSTQSSAASSSQSKTVSIKATK